jgi:hypothetical protein
MIEDPDPYLVIKDPDPDQGGPKTYGSSRSGSVTLLLIERKLIFGASKIQAVHLLSIKMKFFTFLPFLC